MTDSQCVDLLRSLRRTAIIVGLACSVGSIIAATAIALWVSAHNRAELMRLMQSFKCECGNNAKQIHEQHVTLAPNWDREDTVREQLKLRAQARQNDDMQ